MHSLDDIWGILSNLQRRTPSPAPQDSYQYFWEPPEKQKTVVQRQEQMGGQAEPLGGEVGREAAAYNAQEPGFADPSVHPQADVISRLPIKMRQKYLTLLGGVAPDSYASQR